MISLNTIKNGITTTFNRTTQFIQDHKVLTGIAIGALATACSYSAPSTLASQAVALASNSALASATTSAIAMASVGLMAAPSPIIEYTQLRNDFFAMRTSHLAYGEMHDSHAFNSAFKIFLHKAIEAKNVDDVSRLIGHYDLMDRDDRIQTLNFLFQSGDGFVLHNLQYIYIGIIQDAAPDWKSLNLPKCYKASFEDFDHIYSLIRSALTDPKEKEQFARHLLLQGICEGDLSFYSFNIVDCNLATPQNIMELTLRAHLSKALEEPLHLSTKDFLSVVLNHYNSVDRTMIDFFQQNAKELLPAILEDPWMLGQVVAMSLIYGLSDVLEILKPHIASMQETFDNGLEIKMAIANSSNQALSKEYTPLLAPLLGDLCLQELFEHYLHQFKSHVKRSYFSKSHFPDAEYKHLRVIIEAMSRPQRNECASILENIILYEHLDMCVGAIVGTGALVHGLNSATKILKRRRKEAAARILQGHARQATLVERFRREHAACILQWHARRATLVERFRRKNAARTLQPHVKRRNASTRLSTKEKVLQAAFHHTLSALNIEHYLSSQNPSWRDNFNTLLLAFDLWEGNENIPEDFLESFQNGLENQVTVQNPSLNDQEIQTRMKEIIAQDRKELIAALQKGLHELSENGHDVTDQLNALAARGISFPAPQVTLSAIDIGG